MKNIHLIFAFVIGLFIAVSVNAQSNENQLYYVNKVTVKPERIEQLLEISKTWLSAAKLYKYPYSV